MSVVALFWLDGTLDVVEAGSPSEAFNKLGYGGGAISALDFYSESNNEVSEVEANPGYYYDSGNWHKMSDNDPRDTCY